MAKRLKEAIRDSDKMAAAGRTIAQRAVTADTQSAGLRIVAAPTVAKVEPAKATSIYKSLEIEMSSVRARL
jgi:hypothetical protein